MVVRVKVDIEGYARVMRKLRHEELLAGPWAAAMRQVEQVARHAWMGAAPRGKTGLLRAKIATRTQPKPIPKWVRIKTTAARTTGTKWKRYRYPRRLEYDKRSRHYLKLTTALQRSMGTVQAVLDRAARAIEAKWRA